MNLIGTLVSWSLILHGTKDYPIRLKQSDSNTQPEVTETPVFTGTTLPPVSQKSAYWENFSRFHLKEIVIKLKEGNWNNISFQSIEEIQKQLCLTWILREIKLQQCFNFMWNSCFKWDFLDALFMWLLQKGTNGCVFGLHLLYMWFLEMWRWVCRHVYRKSAGGLQTL